MKWWWRFPLFCAGLVLAGAFIVLVTGNGILIGAETRDGVLSCRYLTLRGAVTTHWMHSRDILGPYLPSEGCSLVSGSGRSQ